MVGFNDTQQTPHSFGGWTEVLWSFLSHGLATLELNRSDGLRSRSRDVDQHRIAATGGSGGASQTFLLAADDRVRYVAPVNMVSAHMQGGTPVKRLPAYAWIPSTSRLQPTAPRPMLLVSLRPTTGPVTLPSRNSRPSDASMSFTWCSQQRAERSYRCGAQLQSRS